MKFLEDYASHVCLFYVIPACRPITGLTGVIAFNHHVLKALSVELLACFISLISSGITVWEPALGLTVIDIETYRGSGAIESRPNAL